MSRSSDGVGSHWHSNEYDPNNPNNLLPIYANVSSAPDKRSNADINQMLAFKKSSTDERRSGTTVRMIESVIPSPTNVIAVTINIERNELPSNSVTSVMSVDMVPANMSFSSDSSVKPVNIGESDSMLTGRKDQNSGHKERKDYRNDNQHSPKSVRHHHRTNSCGTTIESEPNTPMQSPHNERCLSEDKKIIAITTMRDIGPPPGLLVSPSTSKTKSNDVSTRYIGTYTSNYSNSNNLQFPATYHTANLQSYEQKSNSQSYTQPIKPSPPRIITNPSPGSNRATTRNTGRTPGHSRESSIDKDREQTPPILEKADPDRFNISHPDLSFKQSRTKLSEREENLISLDKLRSELISKLGTKDDLLKDYVPVEKPSILAERHRCKFVPPHLVNNPVLAKIDKQTPKVASKSKSKTKSRSRSRSISNDDWNDEDDDNENVPFEYTIGSCFVENKEELKDVDITIGNTDTMLQKGSMGYEINEQIREINVKARDMQANDIYPEPEQIDMTIHGQVSLEVFRRAMTIYDKRQEYYLRKYNEGVDQKLWANHMRNLESWFCKIVEPGDPRELRIDDGIDLARRNAKRVQGLSDYCIPEIVAILKSK